MQLIIYTCITNDFDWLLPPVWRSQSVRYICFTDNILVKPNGWEIYPLPSHFDLNKPRMVNRFCKLFPWKVLPKHTWSVYIDGTIRLVSDPSPVFGDMVAVGVDMAIPIHPFRTDIWEEATACKAEHKISRSDHSVLNQQLARYESDGLPKAVGLTENNVIFRSGESMRLLPVMETWWDELENGVQRDQISLPYVLWLTKTTILRLPFSARDANPYLRKVSHKGKGGIVSYLKARRYHGQFWFVVYAFVQRALMMRRRVVEILRKRDAC